MDFVPETIVRVAFCLPILLHACSSIWTLASQMQPEYKKKVSTRRKKKQHRQETAIIKVIYIKIHAHMYMMPIYIFKQNLLLALIVSVMP